MCSQQNPCSFGTLGSHMVRACPREGTKALLSPAPTGCCGGPRIETSCGCFTLQKQLMLKVAGLTSPQPPLPDSFPSSALLTLALHDNHRTMSSHVTTQAVSGSLALIWSRYRGGQELLPLPQPGTSALGLSGCIPSAHQRTFPTC